MSVIVSVTGGTPDTCPAGQIRCKNGDCVIGKLCDGLPECYDSSDEDDCGKLILYEVWRKFLV